MEQTRRVNKAIALLGEETTASAAAAALVAQFGISARQAHRYLQRAQRTAQPLPSPEEKEVFTVRLPSGLIREVRATARKRKRRISDLAAEALRAFLNETSHG